MTQTGWRGRPRTLLAELFIGAGLVAAGAVAALLIGVLAIAGVGKSPPSPSKGPPLGDFGPETVFVSLTGAHHQRLVHLRAEQKNALTPMTMTEGIVARLPCLHQKYVLGALIESDSGRESVEYTGDLIVDAVDLPRGQRCMEPLPSDIGRDATLTLTSRESTGSPEPLITVVGKRESGGNFKGRLTETNEPCPARYRLRVRFDPPGHPAHFSYGLRITHTIVNGIPDGSCH